MKLNEFAHEFCKQNLELTLRKNADYTGGKSIWYNFEQVRNYSVNPVKGFITRIVDKISRIETYLEGKKLQVSDESGYDTLRDLANYAMLLTGYVFKATDLKQHATDFYAKVLTEVEHPAHVSLDAVKHCLRSFAADGNTKHLVQMAKQAILLAYEAQ